MKFTLESLNNLTPSEFESIRARGCEFRRKMSDAVTMLLTVPENWQVNAEYRCEFGGMFPVQCRLSANECDEFHLCICSPGEISPDWLVVLLGGCGDLVQIVHQSDRLDLAAVNGIIQKVAGMKRFNCTAKTVADLLCGEVAL